MCTLAPSIKEANFWKKNMPYALCLREISVDFIMFEDVASYNVMDWGYMFINCQLWKKKNILGHIRKLNRQNLFRQKNGHSKVLKVPQFFPPFWEDANNLWINHEIFSIAFNVQSFMTFFIIVFHIWIRKCSK